MARQNIDEEWKTDPRRDYLAQKLGDPWLADAARVHLNWLILDHKGQDVPFEKFKFFRSYKSVLDSGLAMMRGDNVHIVGSDRYAKWFEKQAQNGFKRKKRGENPLDTKLSQTKPNEANTSPKKPSLSFSLEKEIYIVQKNVFDEKLNTLYKKYPRKEGKSRGMARLKRELRSEADLLDFGRAVDNYRAYCEREKRETKYIKLFSSFVSEWRDWLDPETGTSEVLDPHRKAAEMFEVRDEV